MFKGNEKGANPFIDSRLFHEWVVWNTLIQIRVGKKIHANA